jgi:hypothetical protein
VYQLSILPLLVPVLATYWEEYLSIQSDGEGAIQDFFARVPFEVILMLAVALHEKEGRGNSLGWNFLNFGINKGKLTEDDRNLQDFFHSFQNCVGTLARKLREKKHAVLQTRRRRGTV